MRTAFDVRNGPLMGDVWQADPIAGGLGVVFHGIEYTVQSVTGNLVGYTTYPNTVYWTTLEDWCLRITCDGHAKHISQSGGHA